MKKGGGKPKGTQYERDVSVILSQWWDNRDDVFWHTHGSGSRSTVRQKKGKKTAGSASDLMALDEVGQPFVNHFLVEIKRGYNKDLDVLDVVDSNKKEHMLINWWLKAEFERQEADKIDTLIIVKRDYKNAFLIMDTKLLDTFENYCNIYDQPVLTIFEGNNHLSIISFDYFLTWCPAENIRLMINA